MPTLSSMKIPPPISWEEFEEITLDACKIRWENPDLQMHGRKGQAQNGVDIYGSNHLFDSIGVQLRRKLELPIVDYNSDESRFFKHYYSQTYHEHDPMTAEIDVIRKTEGW